MADWPLDAWRFDLVLAGAPPAAWRESTVTEGGIVFPVLDRLRFEGEGPDTRRS
jgi:hypothetical protein